MPVRHRRQVPFHPSVQVPPDLAERALDIRRLDAELERFVLRAEDYFEFATEAMAQNIHYSTKLEGNKVPLPEVRRITRRSLLGEAPRTQNPGVQEIINHVLAWRAPVLPKPWTLGGVLQLHRALMQDVEPPARPGLLRDEDLEVYEGEEVAFIPAPREHVEPETEALLQWVNLQSAGYLPAVAATVMFHRFESIHPFTDGNGRMGRSLFHIYLQQHGLRHAHLCLIEPELLSDAGTYYTLLAWTDHTDGYLELVDYFTDAIVKAYRGAVDRFRQKDLLSSDLDETAKRLLVMAKRERAEFSVSDATGWVDGRAEDTIRRHLNHLVEVGALRARGMTRSRRYRFADPFETAVSERILRGARKG